MTRPCSPRRAAGRRAASPAGATRPACSTSRCGCAGPVRALHVNYGLRDASPTPTRRTAPRCARGSACRCDVRRAGEPQRATCRPGRASVRYAEAARLARAARRADRHRPHRDRPGRDRRSTGSPPRPAGARCSGCRRARAGSSARCWRHARGDRGLLPRARPAVARGREQRDVRARRASARTLLPALRELHPAAEENVLRTLALLRDEAAVLDAAVDAALGRRTAGAGADLAALPPALARLALQRLADEAGGRRAPARRPRTPTRSSRWPPTGHARRSTSRRSARRRPSTGGCGSSARDARAAAGARSTLPVPGARRVRRRRARVRARRATSRSPTGRSTPARSPRRSRSAPGAPATGCARSGSAAASSLQDLFTDRKVPRERRAHAPVVVSDGEIAWVPGRRDRRALPRHGRDDATACGCAGRSPPRLRGRMTRRDRRDPRPGRRAAAPHPGRWRRRSPATTRARTCC